MQQHACVGNVDEWLPELVVPLPIRQQMQLLLSHRPTLPHFVLLQHLLETPTRHHLRNADYILHLLVDSAAPLL